MVMYLQFGPPILVKLRFDPCFWKIVVLVPQLKRLNLVFFYALESFILCCFGLFFLAYSIYLLQVLITILNKIFESFIRYSF